MPLPDEPRGAPASAELSADPLVGNVVAGKYRVRRLIARGGMGRIYEAEQLPLGRAVALKFLTPSADDTTVSKRFLLEAATYARLSHPNTVAVYDYGTLELGGEATCFIVLEYVPGRTLAQVLRAEGRLPAARAARIAREICRSLREAHALGIVHRDLKPSNVMLVQRDDGESVKVLDFGVAKAQQEGAETLTGADAFVGTPRYSSPEQIRQATVDGRSDLYSLGVLLFEMLAGVPPFGPGEPLRVLYAHLNQPPPTFAEKGATVPGALEDVVRRCLAKDPADRFADVDALMAALRAADVGLDDTHTSKPGRLPPGLAPTLPPADTSPSLATNRALRRDPTMRLVVVGTVVVGLLGLFGVAIGGALWALRADAPTVDVAEPRGGTPLADALAPLAEGAPTAADGIDGAAAAPAVEAAPAAPSGSPSTATAPPTSRPPSSRPPPAPGAAKPSKPRPPPEDIRTER